MFGCMPPRDVLLTVGNEILEATMSYRCRWFEYLCYRPLLKKYYNSDPNMRHESAPKPRLTDADYRKDYLSDKIGIQKRLEWTENKFFGYEFFKNVKITDTLVLSRLLNPVIDGGHSLKNWGTKLGHSKIEFEQFDFFSEEMLKYCRNDVDLTQRLYKFLITRIKDFGYSVELEHEVAKIIQRQHERGFKIDVVGAYELQAKFQEHMNDLQNKVRATFPPLRIEEVFIPKSNNIKCSANSFLSFKRSN